MFRYMRLVDMLKQVLQKGKQVKDVVYRNKKLNKTQIAASYSLVSLIVNNYDQFLQSCEVLEGRIKDKVTNRLLMMVMMGEYVNTGKIIGGGKLKRLLMDNIDVIPKIDLKSKISKPIVQLRLRTNNQIDEKILQQLEKNGKKDAFVPNLYHFKYEVYSQLTKNNDMDILQSKICVMQSLSSCLPAYLLMHGVAQKWKDKKFDVMDACSAPGNKTIQLAQYLGSNGRVFAFQKDPKRFQLLQRTLSKYEASNVVAQNRNYLEIRPSKMYRKVKFILLDPSCSGSGMLVNFRRDLKQESNGNIQQSFEQFCEQAYQSLSEAEKDRIQKLHNFQVQLLNHAASLQPLRLSFSTCSIHKRENQDVVAKFIKSHPQYRLKKFNIKHEHITNGFGKEFQACFRIDPRNGQSDGFFVAVFTKDKSKSL